MEAGAATVATAASVSHANEPAIKAYAEALAGLITKASAEADAAMLALILEEDAEKAASSQGKRAKVKSKRLAPTARATPLAPQVGGGSASAAPSGTDQAESDTARSSAADEALRQTMASVDLDALSLILEKHCTLASEATLVDARAIRDRLHKKKLKVQGQKQRRAEAREVAGEVPAKVERAAAERVTVESVVVERVAAERAAVKRAEAERAEAERAAAARAAADRADVDAEAANALPAASPVTVVPLSQASLNMGRPEAPESTIGGQTTCIVCFENPKSHLAFPCGHQCACGWCASQMNECPYCCAHVVGWTQARVV